jgi:glycosyltransferase involved in cell wall biosynthesis
MEIIHLILGKANPDRLNGVNKVVYQLATEQARAGKKVSLWGITKDTSHNYPERNFETRLFRAGKNPFSPDPSLVAAILSKKEAVFHLHGGWIPVYSKLAGLFARNRIRFVLTPHGAYNKVAMKRSRLIKKIYFSLFEKQVLRHAWRIHSIGASEVEGLQSVFPNQKSFLLPYGFETNSHAVKPANKNTPFTIGFVGRLDIQTKGLDLLLNAFQNFRKAQPDSELWIIGDGDGRTYIEDYLKKNQLKNVVLWGKKFGAEKDGLIAKMHAFAHPSRNEGLPSAVLEAAALGVPSIVSQATNVAGYISDYNAGIAIANESAIELEQAMQTIKQAYDESSAANYPENCRAMLREVFGWEMLVQEFDKLYN